VKEYLPLLVGIAVVGGLFAWMWLSGNLVRLSNYIQETREELRKCTWPSWDELKGSTVVVLIATVVLGVFTYLTDVFLGFVIYKGLLN
jgi:preprotein translocase subunit SecE